MVEKIDHIPADHIYCANQQPDGDRFVCEREEGHEGEHAAFVARYYKGTDNLRASADWPVVSWT